MKLPVFSTCCCGCTLRTGCLIIGYLGAIGCVFIVISAIVGLADMSYLENVDPSWRSYYTASLVIVLLIYIIHLIFYSILVVGAQKYNTRLLRMFVVWATVLLCFSALSCLMTFIAGSISTAVGNLIGLFLQAYFILIVRSYYLELEMTPRQDNIYFQGQAPQVGPSVYPAQPGYQTQPGYPAQLGVPAQSGYPVPPEYSAQPGYQAQSYGYPPQTGPQVNPFFAKSEPDAIPNEGLPPPKH